MKYRLKDGIDGKIYAVFENPLDAEKIADEYGIGLYCAGGHLNAVLYEEWKPDSWLHDWSACMDT